MPPSYLVLLTFTYIATVSLHAIFVPTALISQIVSDFFFLFSFFLGLFMCSGYFFKASLNDSPYFRRRSLGRSPVQKSTGFSHRVSLSPTPHVAHSEARLRIRVSTCDLTVSPSTTCASNNYRVSPQPPFQLGSLLNNFLSPPSYPLILFFFSLSALSIPSYYLVLAPVILNGLVLPQPAPSQFPVSMLFH